jgi:hypothetical protein
MRQLFEASDADSLLTDVLGGGLCTGLTNERFKRNFFLTRSRINKEKKAVVNSVWLKEIIKEYDTN